MVNKSTISKIVESNLLAGSASRLAKDLGYAGRMSVNRLRIGKAGDDAAKEFCRRVNEVIGLYEEDIENVSKLIELSDNFTTEMLNEKEVLPDSLKFEIVGAFIDDDYSILSESYRQLCLNKWLLLKGHSSEIFFYMLALFLLSDKRNLFYGKNFQPEERYKIIIKPLQKKLEARYPNHSIGNELSRGLLMTPLARLAYPCFLTVIHLAGVLIKGYVSDYSDANNHDLIIKIPQLPDRSFWAEDGDRNEVTFLKYVPVNDKGNGLYEYFKYNIETGKTENNAQFYFYGEGNMGIFLKKERELFFGLYSYDHDNLHLILKPTREKTFEHSWKRLTPETSKRVREIQRLFTDSYLNNVTYESMGLELCSDIVVKEILISKSKVVLLTVDGNKYSIGRDCYSWLKDVTPDILPIVYRDNSDNRKYVEWKELGCRIPLSYFSKTHSNNKVT